MLRGDTSIHLPSSGLVNIYGRLGSSPSPVAGGVPMSFAFLAHVAMSCLKPMMNQSHQDLAMSRYPKISQPEDSSQPDVEQLQRRICEQLHVGNNSG